MVGALGGGAVGYAGARFGTHLMLPIPGAKGLKLLVIAALPLGWLVTVGIHELGHLVGGWLGGGRFLLWVVGPFMVRRTPSGIRPAWNRNINVAGGLAACLPFDPALMSPKRTAVMVLGGPLASLVLVVALLWLAAGLTGAPGPVSTARALVQNVTVFTAGLSLVIFIVTAAPSEAGGFKSDGKRVYELLRGGPRSEQEAALMMLTTAGLAGIRPADCDQALLEKVLSLRDGSIFDLYGHFTAYYCAADRGEWPAAQRHLDYVLGGEDKVMPHLRDVVRCEYAWLIARQTGDATLACAWLETAGNLDFDPATRLRAEAAVLFAEGRTLAAAAKAREGLHAVEHKSLSPVKNPFATEALAEILQRAGS